MGGTSWGLLLASVGALGARFSPSEDGCGREGGKRWRGGEEVERMGARE